MHDSEQLQDSVYYGDSSSNIGITGEAHSDCCLATESLAAAAGSCSSLLSSTGAHSLAAVAQLG